MRIRSFSSPDALTSSAPTTTFATVLSPYQILTSGKLVVDKAALAKIEEVFA